MQEKIKIYCDNTSAIRSSKEDKITPRNKHIDVSYHLSRDYQDKGLISFEYIPTDKMTADCLTKPVAETKLKRNLFSLGIRNDVKFEEECEKTKF